jgi:excisionase family DNA binding protein
VAIQISPTAKDAKVANAILNAISSEDSSDPISIVIGKNKLVLSSNMVTTLQATAELSIERKPFSIMAGTELFTTQQAADYLGYSRPTLIKLLDKFSIPFSKVGRHRKVSFENLEELRLAIMQDQDDFLREMSNLEQKLGKDV